MEQVNVEELRKKIMEDGVVTKEEVVSIWAIKDSCEGDTSIEFDDLFVEVVMAWLLADGEIDEEEAQFLIDKINEDENVDDAEESLLNEIADFAYGHSIPQSLIDAFPEVFEEDED